MNIQKLKLLLATACLAPLPLIAQITERERPAEWKHLITGGRYMDRFEAMPEGTLSGDTWGADSVRPRYIDNGILCRALESDAGGHQPAFQQH